VVKRPRGPALALLLAAGGLLATLSCQLILGVEEPVGIARDAATLDASKDPCAHFGPPPPPEVDDDPRGTSQKNYWLAIERVILPMRPDAGIQPGVDLDQSCTCGRDLHDGAPPCRTPAQDGVCDFEGGVDDGLGTLALQYATALPNVDLSERVNVGIRDGERTLLLYLASYNGKANDRDVGIAFVGGSGIHTELGCDDRPHDAGPPKTLPDAGKPGPQRAPVWDGCDRWTPVPGLVAGKFPDRIATNVLSAYVRDFVLVIQVKELAMDLFGGSVKAGNAVVVAKLRPETTGFAADGFIAGRLEFNELMNAFARSVAPNSEGGVPLCATPAWRTVAPAFCGARDTMRSPELDHAGEICDAMTGTIGFRSRPVQVADGQFPNPTRGVECTDDTPIVCPLP
jgi:hypothetical protein